jgi:CHAD domain-containing protein
MPVVARRSRLLRKRLDQFTRMLPGVDQGDDEALHRTRIASRRLREVLPILQLEGEIGSKLIHRLRRVTRRLGVVRELDVLLHLIDELHESGRHDPRAVRRLATAVAGERSKARDRLMSRLPTAELHRIGAKLDKVDRRMAAADESAPDTDEGKGKRNLRWAVDARVARRASELKGAINDAGALYLPERLHALRIAVKKLRYGLELSAELDGVKSNADLRTLKRSQDLLGRLHDLQILTDRAREVQASLAPPAIKDWREIDGVITWVEEECRRLHGRYMRQRPALAAICDRLSGRSRTPLARRAG